MLYVLPLSSAAAGPLLPRGAETVQTTQAVRPSAETGGARLDAQPDPRPGAQPGFGADRPDPDAPVGPPPAFAANVIEAERARLTAPPARMPADPADTPVLAAGAVWAAEDGSAPGWKGAGGASTPGGSAPGQAGRVHDGWSFAAQAASADPPAALARLDRSL